MPIEHYLPFSICASLQFQQIRRGFLQRGCIPKNIAALVLHIQYFTICLLLIISASFRWEKSMETFNQLKVFTVITLSLETLLNLLLHMRQVAVQSKSSNRT
jgi:hypothetical protein